LTPSSRFNNDVKVFGSKHNKTLDLFGFVKVLETNVKEKSTRHGMRIISTGKELDEAGKFHQKTSKKQQEPIIAGHGRRTTALAVTVSDR
jgi:hypothetical protein